jgi:hypothetical protein
MKNIARQPTSSSLAFSIPMIRLSPLSVELVAFSRHAEFHCRRYFDRRFYTPILAMKLFEGANLIPVHDRQ